MAKFSSASKSPAKTVSRAVLATEGTTPDTTTFEGGSAYSRDDRSELFLLGVSNFVGEDTFYESASDRDERFAALSRKVAVNDPEWFARFVAWLRAEGNMRSAPLVAAAEGVKGRLDALKANPDVEFAGPSNREIIASVLRRADEPSELIGYWQGKYGQGIKAQLPKPVKRGIADRVMSGLYSQYSALKYDTDARTPRFGDVLNLVHPDALNDQQEQFYTWLLDRRFGRTEGKTYDQLDMVNARKALQEIPQAERREWLAGNEYSEELTKQAGVTWEWLASWLGSKLDASFWEAMIPNMGYMATIRNLRNFDQAGISVNVAARVAAKIADPDQVARSRQLPFRFLNAYKASSSDNYSLALSKALDLSTGNIPELGGRTLILTDTSGSMTSKPSEKSSSSMMEIAALFAFALAKKSANVDVYGFGNEPYAHPVNRGFSVPKETKKFLDRGAVGGHGTAVAYSLGKVWKGHDRVIVLSDEQTVENVHGWSVGRVGDVDSAVPEHVKVYGFNLAGYTPSMLPSKKNRVQLGGVSDHTFKQIQLLEQGLSGTWPWTDAE